MYKKGYKASHNHRCIGFKYEVGCTYSMEEEAVVCSHGFHYCKKAFDTLNYYSYNKDFNLFEIQDMSNSTDMHQEKCATNKIKIIREVTDPEELFSLLGVYRKYNKKGVLVFEKTKESEKRFNGQTGKIILEKTKYSENEYDGQTGNIIFEKTKDKEVHYYKISYSTNRRKTKFKKTKYEETYFNKDGYVTKYIDLKKRITTKYTYSSDNVLLKQTSSNGYKYVANKHGQVILEIKPNGLKKEVSYNTDGYILKTQYSNGKFETFEYTDDNRLLNYVNTDGTTIKNIYKNNKLVRSEENIIKTYKNGVKNCNFTY